MSVSGNHEWRSKNNSGKYKFHSIFKNAPSFERHEKTETGQRFFLWYSGKARFNYLESLRPWEFHEFRDGNQMEM